MKSKDVEDFTLPCMTILANEAAAFEESKKRVDQWIDDQRQEMMNREWKLINKGVK